MLAVENLRAAYGEIEVLHGISLAVEPGQLIALLGANGAGKSTVIKAIMGLVPPSAGRVLLDGTDLAGQAAHLVARAGIALVPEGRKIFKKMTVEENLQVGGVVRSATEVRSIARAPGPSPAFSTERVRRNAARASGPSASGHRRDASDSRLTGRWAIAR